MLCPAFLRRIRLSTSLLRTPSNTNFLLKSCPRRLIPCWLLTNTAVVNFRCHKLIAKVKNQNNSDMKNFICNQFGERHPILSAENSRICRRIPKRRLKCNVLAFSFHIGWISAEIWIFNFPRYCSNMPKVRWAMSYRFCSKFHTLSSSAKILRIG